MRLGVKPASNQWVKPTGTTLRFVPAAYLGVKLYCCVVRNMLAFYYD